MSPLEAASGTTVSVLDLLGSTCFSENRKALLRGFQLLAPWLQGEMDNFSTLLYLLLVNLETGEVCNANKVKVGENTGITTLTDDMNNIRSIDYFDLSGRKVSRAQQGVSIMRINYNNGTSKSVKVLRK